MKAAPWIAFAAVLGITLCSVPPGTRMWDAKVKLAVARTFVSGGGLQMTSPGSEALMPMAGIDGKLVSYFPVLACLAWLPTVAVERLTGKEVGALPPLLMLSLLAAVVTVWAARRGVAPTPALASALLVCLGTVLWPTSAEAQDNVIESLVLAVLLWAAAGERVRDWAIAGAAVGAAFCTRQTAVMLAIPALTLLLERRAGLRASALRIGAACAAGIPFVALWVWYDVYRFGRPFWIPRGVGQFVTSPFSDRHLVGIAGLLVSPGKGVLWYSPLLILPLVLLPALWRSQRAGLLAIGGHFLAMVVFCGIWDTWHGDWAWGPRYVLTGCLLVAPAGWVCWQRLAAARTSRRVIAGAAAASVILFSGLCAMGAPSVVYHLDVVHSAARAGHLHTKTDEPPRDDRDWRFLYFTPSNSALASYGRYLVRNLTGELTDGQELFTGAMRVVAGLLAAALSLLVVARADRRAQEKDR